MKNRIYLASALFTVAEQEYNEKLANILRYSKEYVVYLPQESCKGLTDPKQISLTCIRDIEKCQIVVANMEGTDVDSGTAWECGYAAGINKPVIGVRTDFRQRGDDGGLNCMLSRNSVEIVTGNDINEVANEIDRIIKSLKI
jgi:nucleoside 2-deoxyribosyltransferase